MADETTAMVQMISLTMNGTEKVIRGGAAIIKVMARVLYQIYLKIKQRVDLLPGERMMMRFALDGKPLQCLTLNKEQFDLFKKNAVRYNIQYHHVNNKRGKDGDMVTLFVPESDAHKFNRLVNDLKLNSVQTVGTVRAEDVHPMKKPDMDTAVAESVNKEGVLDVTELRNNLIKGGLDPDEADAVVKDYVASPEFSATVDNGKNPNIPPIEVSKEMIKEPAATEASVPDITDKVVPFGADGISTRNWAEDRPLLVERRNYLSNSLKDSADVDFEGFRVAEINRLDRCIELGDKGELVTIESDPELASAFENAVGGSPDVVLSEVIPTTQEVAEGDISGAATATEATTAEVGEGIGTVSIANKGMEGGMGTTNYAEIVEAPSKIGEILPNGPDLGPDITMPAPSV